MNCGRWASGAVAEKRPTSAMRAAVAAAVAAVVAELGRLRHPLTAQPQLHLPGREPVANGFGTVVDIDLKGTFNVSRGRCAPQMRRGSVINISATLPYLGRMGQAHASAAKAVSTR